MAVKRKKTMARKTRAALHLSIEEVKARMKEDPRSWCRQRWLIIYNALVDPREASEIAKHVGFSVHTVHKVVSLYNKLGVQAVETAGKEYKKCVMLNKLETMSVSSLLEETKRVWMIRFKLIPTPSRHCRPGSVRSSS